MARFMRTARVIIIIPPFACTPQTPPTPTNHSQPLSDEASKIKKDTKKKIRKSTMRRQAKKGGKPKQSSSAARSEQKSEWSFAYL